MKLFVIILLTSFSMPSFAKISETTASLVAKAYVQALGARGVTLSDSSLNGDFIDITYCDERHCDDTYEFMVDQGECAIFVSVSYQGQVTQSSNDWTCVAIPEHY